MTFRHFALALVMIAALSASASAYSFRLEIVTTDTVDGHFGFVVSSHEPGDPDEELFFFLESGQVRFYAWQEIGTAWETIPPELLFLTPRTGAVAAIRREP